MDAPHIFETTRDDSSTLLPPLALPQPLLCFLTLKAVQKKKMGRFAPGFVDVTLFPRALPATNYSIAFNDPSVKFAPDGAWKTKDTASGTAYSNVSTATVTVEFIGSAVWVRPICLCATVIEQKLS